MIEFHFETSFRLSDETKFADWVSRIIKSESGELGHLDYIFCADDYLLKINKQFLNHDTFTDIITFDYTDGFSVEGDIFISVDRVRENAREYDVDFDAELLRVMAHGVLHLMGYNDKSKGDVVVMRSKENEKMKMFHVEQ